MCGVLKGNTEAGLCEKGLAHRIRTIYLRGLNKDSGSIFHCVSFKDRTVQRPKLRENVNKDENNSPNGVSSCNIISQKYRQMLKGHLDM